MCSKGTCSTDNIHADMVNVDTDLILRVIQQLLTEILNKEEIHQRWKIST